MQTKQHVYSLLAALHVVYNPISRNCFSFEIFSFPFVSILFFKQVLTERFYSTFSIFHASNNRKNAVTSAGNKCPRLFIANHGHPINRNIKLSSAVKPNTTVRLPCPSYCHELLDFVPVTSTQFVLSKEHQSEFTETTRNNKIDLNTHDLTSPSSRAPEDLKRKQKRKKKTIPLKKTQKNSLSRLYPEKYSPIRKKWVVISNHLDPNFHQPLIEEKYWIWYSSFT